MECELSAFIETAIYNINTQDSLNLCTEKILVCTKKQCTQHLHKHTFLPQKFSIYQTLYILISLHAWLQTIFTGIELQSFPYENHYEFYEKLA